MKKQKKCEHNRTKTIKQDVTTEWECLDCKKRYVTVIFNPSLKKEKKCSCPENIRHMRGTPCIETESKKQLVRCERCGRIRPLFQYSFFDTDPKIWQTIDTGGVKKTIIDNRSRGLCEECGVEINKREYDSSRDKRIKNNEYTASSIPPKMERSFYKKVFKTKNL